MEAIDIVVSDVAEASTNVQAGVDSQVPRGRVIQKNYVLNDTAAMKKKLKNETSKKEPFNAGTDAKDGSNVVILMKTSFFEHVKSCFIQDLVKMEGVVKIENAVGVKVQSTSSGEGFVEYALDITFKVNDNNHAVKITAYATTCKLMIQPLGEKAKALDYLGKRTVTRYFVDTFLLPWCEEAFANKKYNEVELIEAIKNEIIRLDLLKVDSKKANSTRSRISSTPATEAKCVSRTCKFSGLDRNNKIAVGVCAKCGCFEHFECSKTKPDEREMILKGEQNYYWA